MAEVLCGVCNTQPKKYKCPTCSLPYCSLPCFKSHKETHTDDEPKKPAPSPSDIIIPNPPAPKPPPKYLQSKKDFSVLATNPKYQELLKTYPTLLPTLQRIYARTIEPDPDDVRRQQYRDRVFNDRARGRGRGGRGGRGSAWGRGRNDHQPKWTQKSGDNSALKLMKSIRDGKASDVEMEGLSAFVSLVEETYEKKDSGTGSQDTGERVQI